jgi:multidrug resistance protein, MATE family
MKQEPETSSAKERSLLWDNHIPPSRYPRASTNPSFERRSGGDEESALFPSDEDPEPSEATALLRDLKLPHGSEGTPSENRKRWEEVASRKAQTSWQQEAKVLARSSRSLILTFMLQYSLPVASISSVGHIGKIELGAVSIAAMTANITGYAVYQGLAISLDTLCAQAYGSGRKTLVGLQMQRMVYFLWLMTIPIGMIWLAGTQILEAIVPEKETAALAGLYLKIILVGSPGMAAFEGGKRFVQAQGLFSATLYVLLFCAPLNAFMNWLFVWVSGHEFEPLRKC